MDLDSIIRNALRLAESRGRQKDSQFEQQQAMKNREFDFATGKKFNADFNFKKRELDQKDYDRQQLSDLSKMKSETDRYGYDKRFEGDKYGSDARLKGLMYGADAGLKGQQYQTDALYGQGGAWDRREKAETDRTTMQHGHGGSMDRGYEAEKGIWSQRTDADRAAQEELARQKNMASIYETVFNQTGDAGKATEAARSFGAKTPNPRDYDSGNEQPQRPVSPEQARRNTMMADDAYNRLFGGSPQTLQQPVDTMSPPEASLRQLAGTPSPRQSATRVRLPQTPDWLSTPIVPTLFNSLKQNIEERRNRIR